MWLSSCRRARLKFRSTFASPLSNIPFGRVHVSHASCPLLAARVLERGTTRRNPVRGRRRTDRVSRRWNGHARCGRTWYCGGGRGGRGSHYGGGCKVSPEAAAISAGAAVTVGIVVAAAVGSTAAAAAAAAANTNTTTTALATSTKHAAATAVNSAKAAGPSSRTACVAGFAGYPDFLGIDKASRAGITALTA
jgi:hypothetical protein